MSEEITFSPYDGKSDCEFNRALFASLVSQYSDYTDMENAERAVCQFMPNSAVIDEVAGYSAAHSLASYRNNKILALTCIVPFGEQGNLISTMEVLKEYRGNGFGSELLSKALNNKGPSSVYVSVHKPEVRDFYAKNGFIEQEKAKSNLYGIDMEFLYMSCI